MKKEKTNWAFVTVLLSVVALQIIMVYTIKFIDTQAQRIDALEMDNIRLMDRI